MLDVTQNDSQFSFIVLFSDEGFITTEVVVNTHNVHMWSLENLHSTVWSNGVNIISVLISIAEILGDHLL